MKTTLDLPDDLMREAKIRAAREGKKLKDIVASALRRGLSTPEISVATDHPLIKISPEGFPYIPCSPGSPKPNLTIEEILELEQKALTADDLARAGLTP